MLWYGQNAVANLHTHIVDGQPVTHSHPYSGKIGHSHSTAQLTLTAALSMLCAAPTAAPAAFLCICPESAAAQFAQFCSAPALHGTPLRGPPSL
ncbi:MAG: hypothetical protein LBU95_03900 [Rikenellaceae bacterium]|nr:hypothetical protein [Rikenellaceae bacterium]